jgi:hypothetical protein
MIEDSLWKIFGIILGVVLIFVVPTVYSYQRQDDIVYNLIMTEANEFSQKIRESGKVNRQMLDELNQVLQASGLTYEIELEHQQKRFSEDEGFMEVYYDGVYTDRIFEWVETQGAYRLNSGDFFYVRIRNTSRTKGQSFRNILGIGGMKNSEIYIVSGGIVRYGNG